VQAKGSFRKAVELAPAAIVFRDIDNRVLRVNQELTKLFGFTVEQALGRSCVCNAGVLHPFPNSSSDAGDVSPQLESMVLVRLRCLRASSVDSKEVLKDLGRLTICFYLQKTGGIRNVLVPLREQR
jgi:PAS domain-containing protein